MKTTQFHAMLWTLLMALFFSTGCASSNPQKDLERLTEEQASTIRSLQQEVSRLNEELGSRQAPESKLQKEQTIRPYDK